MPSEKEALAIKKIENEFGTHPDSAIKPERPARKRSILLEDGLLKLWWLLTEDDGNGVGSELSRLP
ncbi:hypothetical protein OSB04_021025 [Centaurea solstitialis]|uniref:Uncharacterized protein n=1 Tax=Centaurea solstitialis TaxID=347529 RepID=A0AA38W4I3_9ASTR|nr:hypothetical protein OSB04_021025 [Centaurea solstitialis]